MTTNNKPGHLSHYVKDEYGDCQPCSEACAAFEAFLIAEGYELAIEFCSWDSEEGGYLGAVGAFDVVQEFVDCNPRYEPYQEAIEAHAVLIGEVCNIGAQEEAAYRASEASAIEAEEPDFDDEP